ncbi:hypothetical protein [Streptomyces sp. NPDC088789]|uniref:hypothetical protein n=1 Tax=Streptomyces sp. NPDC088789 TaxID=3365899 RepID=UPI0037FFEDF1
MGYDIYIQTPDGKPVAGDENYFRIGYFAMPRFLRTMNDCGMLTELPVPTGPTLSEHGLTVENFEPGTQPDQATADRIAAFRAAYQAVMDAAEPKPRGIPSYKLQFNDGFLTTVAEIRAAMAAYDDHPHEDLAASDDPMWRSWTAFLRRAQTHGGLRTY